MGQDEADMKVNRISIQSPVGKALIGKRVGDFVEVKTPVKDGRIRSGGDSIRGTVDADDAAPFLGSHVDR